MERCRENTEMKEEYELLKEKYNFTSESL